MIEMLVDVAGIDQVFHAGEIVEFTAEQEQHWIAAGYAKPHHSSPAVNVTLNVGGNTEIEILE